MKTPKIIVVLLILLGMSASANANEVRGFTEDDCDYEGDYHTAGSYAELKEIHDADNKWEFKSYHYTADSENCLIFEEDMEEVIAIGTRLPKHPGGGSSGDSGRGSGSGNELDVPYNYKDNPGKNFDSEESQEIVDCLDEATANMDWTGDHTDAKWIADKNKRKDNWSVTNNKNWYHGKYGEANYGKDNVSNFKIDVQMHGINMGNIAKKESISFRHILIYWHIHELVHVMQAEEERNDGDSQYIPSDNFFSRWYRELEAIEGVDKIWRDLFGQDFDPPFLIPDYLVNFDDNYARREELLDKEADGTLSRKEKRELKKLNRWYEQAFAEIPIAVVNKYYKNKKLNHCQ